MRKVGDRNPVLLIHGIDDTADVFSTMAPYLRVQGWQTYDLNLIPCNGDVGLDQLAQQVADYVTQTFPANQPIDLVGFSMGGIISRYYVQRLGGIDRVQRFVTISSPHQGTWTAYLRPNLGASQMRWGSPFMNALNSDVDMLQTLHFTSIWTPLDLMIVPAESSRLPVGKEVVVNVPAHSWMLTHSRSLQAVCNALAAPLPARADHPVSQNQSHR